MSQWNHDEQNIIWGPTVFGASWNPCRRVGSCLTNWNTTSEIKDCLEDLIKIRNCLGVLKYGKVWVKVNDKDDSDDDCDYLNKTSSSYILLKHTDPLLCTRQII